ncbi:MAG: penicillin-insensitive murein endopeptidase, partial [Candidatus Binatia bacterium]
MRVVPAAALCLALSAAAAAGSGSWTDPGRWSAQAGPSAGPPQAIGFYTAGCIEGALALPPRGPGFEVVRLRRRRYFGHPDLVAYVRRLADSAAKAGLPPLLVGDLSQPRGGPTPSDHGSHQSGLDVDIAYTRPPAALRRPLDENEREAFLLIPVVDVER